MDSLDDADSKLSTLNKYLSNKYLSNEAPQQATTNE